MNNGMYFDVEYTDTVGGEANYSWIRRATVWMPEMPHFGYDGTNYGKTAQVFNRELMKKAKREMGLTGVRGRTHVKGDSLVFRPYVQRDSLVFRPYGQNTVLCITYRNHAIDEQAA